MRRGRGIGESPRNVAGFVLGQGRTGEVRDGFTPRALILKDEEARPRGGGRARGPFDDDEGVGADPRAQARQHRRHVVFGDVVGRVDEHQVDVSRERFPAARTQVRARVGGDDAGRQPRRANVRGGDAGRGRRLFDEGGVGASARQGFEAKGARSGVEVEDGRALQHVHVVQARKEGLADPLGGGTSAGLGHGEGTPLGAACDDSGHTPTLPGTP